MAIGERIHYFRCLKGMTQKTLGQLLGFPERSADVRMAQYETGNRTPKADITEKLAALLEVSPEALNVPDIDSYIGLMHTLFALEDIYGLTIGEIDGEVCLRLDKFNKNYLSLFDRFHDWNEENKRLKTEEITKEEYNSWRYTYPKIPAERKKAALDAIRNQK